MLGGLPLETRSDSIRTDNPARTIARSQEKLTRRDSLLLDCGRIRQLLESLGNAVRDSRSSAEQRVRQALWALRTREAGPSNGSVGRDRASTVRGKARWRQAGTFEDVEPSADGRGKRLQAQ